MTAAYRTDIPHIPFDPAWLIYEDEALLVINKPSGLLSVPGRNVHPESNLLAQVQTHCSEALIVHRLDMDTSGLMVLAKNKAAHRHLSIQFQDRLTDKRYQAICYGRLSQPEGQVQLPMRCDWEKRPLQMIDFRQGKAATTQWQAKDLGNGLSLLSLTPITGRSHQLRLHMKILGHPILGDNLYADSRSFEMAERLLLHACALSFSHPTHGQKLSFEHNENLNNYLTGT